MKPPNPLRFPPLPHQQFQFLPLHISQQPQQGLYFIQGHLGQVHAASLLGRALGICQTSLHDRVGNSTYENPAYSLTYINRCFGGV